MSDGPYRVKGGLKRLRVYAEGHEGPDADLGKFSSFTLVVASDYDGRELLFGKAHPLASFVVSVDDGMEIGARADENGRLSIAADRVEPGPHKLRIRRVTQVPAAYDPDVRRDTPDLVHPDTREQAEIDAMVAMHADKEITARERDRRIRIIRNKKPHVWVNGEGVRAVHFNEWFNRPEYMG